MNCEAFDPYAIVFKGTMAPEEEAHLEECDFCKDDIEHVKYLLLYEPLDMQVSIAPTEDIKNRPFNKNVQPLLPKEVHEHLLSFPITPLFADEITEGRNFARMSVEPVSDSEFRKRFRLFVFVPKDYEFLPVGISVNIPYSIDEDAYLLIVHRDGEGRLTIVYPSRQTPDPFWKLGPPGKFSVRLDGRHGERQKFELLATTKPILNEQIPFGDDAAMTELYADALRKLNSLDPECRCKKVSQHILVDLDIAQKYPTMTLPDLEQIYPHELKDEHDFAKLASAEICKRLLEYPASQWDTEAAELCMLFQKTTRQFIRNAVIKLRGYTDNDLIDSVYSDFFLTAMNNQSSMQQKFLRPIQVQHGRPITIFSHYGLCCYMAGIAKTIVRPEHERTEWKRVKQEITPKLTRALPTFAASDKEALKQWAFRHLLHKAWEKKIFAYHLDGARIRDMLPDTDILRYLGTRHRGSNLNQEIWNRRKEIVWAVFSTVVRKGPEHLQKLLADYKVEIPRIVEVDQRRKDEPAERGIESKTPLIELLEKEEKQMRALKKQAGEDEENEKE